jgi:hypothetical protein
MVSSRMFFEILILDVSQNQYNEISLAYQYLILAFFVAFVRKRQILHPTGETP